VALALVLLHDRAGGYFLGALSVSAGALRALLDVFVLALFLAAYAAQMFATRHGDLHEFQGG
jgi:hypothetical protein